MLGGDVDAVYVYRHVRLKASPRRAAAEVRIDVDGCREEPVVLFNGKLALVVKVAFQTGESLCVRDAAFIRVIDTDPRVVPAVRVLGDPDGDLYVIIDPGRRRFRPLRRNGVFGKGNMRKSRK